ncbi:CU044_2847 family protein [Streptomyces collinus]|uniref:CU044_2847 family protein n=1 Tax=Streptomyces collinus TaxID=42684 RepID=UPI00381DE205
MPDTLRNVLEPITHAGQADLDQLHKAQPDEITVEFGVHRAVEAGVVITKGRAASHLPVTVPWKGDGG